jgi:hypothetical protein
MLARHPRSEPTSRGERRSQVIVTGSYLERAGDAASAATTGSGASVRKDPRSDVDKNAERVSLRGATCGNAARRMKGIGTSVGSRAQTWPSESRAGPLVLQGEFIGGANTAWAKPTPLSSQPARRTNANRRSPENETWEPHRFRTVA